MQYTDNAIMEDDCWLLVVGCCLVNKNVYSFNLMVE